MTSDQVHREGLTIGSAASQFRSVFDRALLGGPDLESLASRHAEPQAGSFVGWVRIQTGNGALLSSAYGA